jgi:nucleotide-binding universal stress UspA family protein
VKPAQRSENLRNPCARRVAGADFAPVAVGRRIAKSIAMKNILVAVDGTEGSLKAAAFARDLSRRFDAHLTLLHVVEPYPSASLTAFGVSSSDFYSTAVKNAEALVGEIVHDLGIEAAEQVIEMGTPSEVICNEADERNVDHIVLGSHGNGKIARLMMGSVSARVTSLSGRCVTIVR